MSNEYYAINRGNDGFKISDFTIGTSSAASTDIELRVATVDGQGKVMTRLDVQKALRAFERALASGKIFTTFPPL
jgi:hypothetical protein